MNQAGHLWIVAYVIDTVMDAHGNIGICGIYNNNNNNNNIINDNITITTLPISKVSQMW